MASEGRRAFVSTQYWVTSAFYLHWISPDQVVYEGEKVYIGCEAVGLDANGPETEPYLFRCTVTNVDEQVAGRVALAGAGVFASLTLTLTMMRPKKYQEAEAAEWALPQEKDAPSRCLGGAPSEIG